MKTTDEIIKPCIEYKQITFTEHWCKTKNQKWISLTDLFVAMGNTNAKLYKDGNGSYEWNEILCEELGID